MNYTFRIVREVLNEDTPTKVRGAHDAARYLYANCFRSEDMGRESVWALTLNGNNEITGQFLVSTGTDRSCILDQKAIAKVAVEAYASGVVLAHNHPSGNVRPSAKDLTETDKTRKALDLLDIRFLDHIVVTDTEYYSFAEEVTAKAPRKSRKAEPVDIFTPEDIENMNRTFALATLKA